MSKPQTFVVPRPHGTSVPEMSTTHGQLKSALHYYESAQNGAIPLRIGMLLESIDYAEAAIVRMDALLVSLEEAWKNDLPVQAEEDKI